ncbi:MAG: metallophosphoesterase [Verrucomicrobiota bacterium]|nr:metallophosphoesterase [Verrucomicrobiota bacterium]MDE3066580.1 metallophosphoesterase [Verrucomicrobiota bacterium]
MQSPAPGEVTVAIVSDLHCAGAAERARGNDYELRVIANPFLRAAVRFYRHVFWMRRPLDQSSQLDRFLAELGPADYLVANGDYSCDSGFVGVSDAAAAESVRECLEKLRARFGGRARFVLGDHELGKLNLAGTAGGMRLASWRCATETLGLQLFWQLTLGRYTLIGVTSSLLALPAFQMDVLPEEWPEWVELRRAHLRDIGAAFDALPSGQRVILFCHDPTALPFLWREEAVRRRLPQMEHTVIGHLHTRLILWKSRVLSGIPPVRFLGRSVGRLTSALHEARYWRPFRVRLCPALSGIELLNDGGYETLQLDPAAVRPAEFTFHPLPR